MRIIAGRAFGLALAGILVLSSRLPSAALSQVAVSATPSSGVAPLAVQFTGPSAGYSFFEWQFDHSGSVFVPDYSSDLSPAVTFTYQTPGNYTARLRSYDATTGVPVDVDVPVTVLPPPIPPTVSLQGPGGLVGTANVSFQAMASAAAGKSIVSYAWDFEGNGVIDKSAGGGPTMNATHTFSQSGPYTTTVVVVDSDGLSASAQLSVIVDDGPQLRLQFGYQIEPVFNPGASPPLDTMDIPIKATASSGKWPIISYAWSVDGQALTPPPGGFTNTLFHRFPYAVQGAHSVDVTVKDSQGLSVSTGFRPGVPPTFNLAYNESGTYPMVASWQSNRDGTITFSAGAPAPVPVVTYQPISLNIIDPPANPTFSMPLPVPVFASGAIWGEYTYHFTNLRNTGGAFDMDFSLLDTGGHLLSSKANTTGVDFVAVKVGPVSVVVDGAAQSTARVGHVFTFSTNISSPDGQTLNESAWDFENDGLVDEVHPLSGTSQQDTALHYFEDPGTYQVVVAAGTSVSGTPPPTPDTPGFGSTTVTVLPGTGTLEAWLSQPRDGDTLSTGTGKCLTLSAKTSPAGITRKVDFYYRLSAGKNPSTHTWNPNPNPWILIATATPPPYSALRTLWDVSGLVDGSSYDLRVVATDMNGVTFDSGTLGSIQQITVTAQAASDQIEITDPSGNSLSRQQGVHTNTGTKSNLGSDTTVELPPASVMLPSSDNSAYTTLYIERVNASPHLDVAKQQGLTFVPGSFRTLTLGTNANLQLPARITLYSVNQNVSSFLSSIGYSSLNSTAAPLAIYRWDTVNGRWSPLVNHVSQPNEDLLRASTVAMGDIGLAVKLPPRTSDGSSSSGGCGALGIEAVLSVLFGALIRRWRRDRHDTLCHA